MHFSELKNNILHFPTYGHTLDHPVCDLHLNLLLEAMAITAAYFVKIKSKHQKVSSARGVGPLH